MLQSWTSTPAWDPQQRAMVWSVDDSAGLAPSFVAADLGVMRGSASWEWTLLAPARADGHLQWPKLPVDSGFDFNPQATDALYGTITAGVWPGGYDQARAMYDTNPTMLQIEGSAATGAYPTQSYSLPSPYPIPAYRRRGVRPR